MTLRLRLWLARPIAAWYHRHVMHPAEAENHELRMALKARTGADQGSRA